MGIRRAAVALPMRDRSSLATLSDLNSILELPCLRLSSASGTTGRACLEGSSYPEPRALARAGGTANQQRSTRERCTLALATVAARPSTDRGAPRRDHYGRGDDPPGDQRRWILQQPCKRETLGTRACGRKICARLAVATRCCPSDVNNDTALVWTSIDAPMLVNLGLSVANGMGLIHARR